MAFVWERKCTSGSNSPGGLEGHTAVVINRRVFVFGGRSTTYQNQLHVLDCDTMQWIKPNVQCAIPPPRCYHVAWTIGDTMFIHGGDGGSTNPTNAINVTNGTNGSNNTSDQTVQLPPTQSRRLSITSVERASTNTRTHTLRHYYDDLFALTWRSDSKSSQSKFDGGDNETDTSSTMIELMRLGLSPETAKIANRVIAQRRNNATQYSHAETSRRDQSLDRLYAQKKEDHTFDAGTNNNGSNQGMIAGWRQIITSLAPLPRKGHTVCVIAGKVVMFGGETASGVTNESYEIDTNALQNFVRSNSPSTISRTRMTGLAASWSPCILTGKPPIPRTRHSCCVIPGSKNRAAMFGGTQDHRAGLNDLHILDMDSRSWTEISLQSMIPDGPKKIPGRFGHKLCSIPVSMTPETRDDLGPILLVYGGTNKTTRPPEFYKDPVLLRLDNFTWNACRVSYMFPVPRTSHAFVPFEMEVIHNAARHEVIAFILFGGMNTQICDGDVWTLIPPVLAEIHHSDKSTFHESNNLRVSASAPELMQRQVHINGVESMESHGESKYTNKVKNRRKPRSMDSLGSIIEEDHVYQDFSLRHSHEEYNQNNGDEMNHDISHAIMQNRKEKLKVEKMLAKQAIVLQATEEELKRTRQELEDRENQWQEELQQKDQQIQELNHIIEEKNRANARLRQSLRRMCTIMAIVSRTSRDQLIHDAPSGESS